jgi:ferric-dicitrate binding protein FerR (iron transport regulator)
LYQKILDKSSELKVPVYKKEALFNKVQEKIALKKKAKTKPVFIKWMYGAAASIAILVGLFYFQNKSTTYSTSTGEQLAVVLPDHSQVLLNANSSVSFNKNKWEENRSVELRGEAYFKVEKGSKFSVETSQGTVAVLGTQFDVISDLGLFQVHCFEGRVQVENKQQQIILTQGKAFRQIEGEASENWNFSTKKPSWTTGESFFKSTPLKYVIKALESQYNVTIKSSGVDLEKRFTGIFNHKNIEIALQTVFVPMKIHATLEDEKTVLLVKQ